MNSEMTGQETRREMPVVGHAIYLEQAPLMDVMMEQLQYLVNHGNGMCGPGCADCARLAVVQSCLLRPFRPSAGVRFSEMLPHAA